MGSEHIRRLGEHGVLDAQTVDLLVKLAGYRNRMVHFYHEEAQSLRDTDDHENGASGSARWAPFSDQVTAAELFGICASELQDVERIRVAYVQWMRQHPELVDDDL